MTKRNHHHSVHWSDETEAKAQARRTARHLSLNRYIEELIERDAAKARRKRKR